MTLRLASLRLSQVLDSQPSIWPWATLVPVLLVASASVFSLHLSCLHDAFRSRTPTDATRTLRAVAADKETPGPVIFPPRGVRCRQWAAHSQRLISVKTALSPMWHQGKQLVILLSHRQNSSLMDWFFTFQPARVGMSPGWCLPSMWAGWGPLHALLLWCWQQPYVPTGPRGAWFGVGAAEGS